MYPIGTPLLKDLQSTPSSGDIGYWENRKFQSETGQSRFQETHSPSWKGPAAAGAATLPSLLYFPLFLRPIGHPRLSHRKPLSNSFGSAPPPPGIVHRYLKYVYSAWGVLAIDYKEALWGMYELRNALAM